MKIARIRLAMALAPALALALSGSMTAAASTAPTGQSQSGRVTSKAVHHHKAKAVHHHKVVVFNCRGRAKVRPRTFVITCADRNDYLTKLRWDSWGPASAVGQGVEWLNNCKPDCASGTFHHHSVQVLFWRIRPVRHHAHEVYFTRLKAGRVNHIL